MKCSTNEITGANLVSKSSNQEAYAEGYDRIFGNKKEELEIIRVFPDYLSSGLWKNYRNVTLKELNIDNLGLEQSIIDWHKDWETSIAKDLWKESPSFVNKGTYDDWYETGEDIVDYMNRYYSDKYKFIYLADTYEEYIKE